MTDYDTLAQRLLGCEARERRMHLWCETHDDPWPCGRAQEVADVLAEELDQPTKEQKMSSDHLTRAREWLECVERDGKCGRHDGEWPCWDARDLAALLAEVAAEGAADGIEGLMHELACHRDAELAARRADQWRAQARATGSGPVSASPAVVAAVQQAMTEHLADFDIEVAAQRCRCGPVVGQSAQAEAHRVEMIAAAAEAAALEATATKFQYSAWIDVLDGDIAYRARNGTEVTRWLRERAEAVRS